MDRATRREKVGAAAALGRRGGVRARAVLGRLLEDSDRRVQDAARSSLGSLENLPRSEGP